jgi:nucleoside-diphosphate-sugar epimerase
MTLAIDNPAEKGEYRVINQFDEVYSVTDLAQLVQKCAHEVGIDASFEHIEDPRIEAEDHYYKPDHNKLLEMGFRPTRTLADELKTMLEDLMSHRDRILAKKDRILPKPYWKM